MRLAMGSLRAGLLFGVMLLTAISLLAAPSSKGKGRATKSSGKQVTVTLVRWPYT